MRLTVYLNQNQNKMKKLLFFISLMPLASFAQQDYNPFEAIGKKVTVVTLSDGRYKETYGGDTVKRIGNVIFDIRTNKIVKFLEENDTTTYEFRKGGDLSTRWLSIDPLAAKYPYLSPYVFVANNPIIYVDQDGRENIIYLVVVKDKNGVSEIKPEQAKAIQQKANAMFEKLGVGTRVVIFDEKTHGASVDVSKLDKNDGVAVIGTNRQNIVDYTKKNISSTRATDLSASWLQNDGENNNPENSANGITSKGNKLGIAIDFDDKSYAGYKKELKIGAIESAAISLVHGAGHNAGAGVKHLDDGIMKDGNEMQTRANNQNTHQGKTFDESILNSGDNTTYKQSMTQRFGKNKASDNYNKTKKSTYAKD